MRVGSLMPPSLSRMKIFSRLPLARWIPKLLLWGTIFTAFSLCVCVCISLFNSFFLPWSYWNWITKLLSWYTGDAEARWRLKAVWVLRRNSHRTFSPSLLRCEQTCWHVSCLIHFRWFSMCPTLMICRLERISGNRKG